MELNTLFTIIGSVLGGGTVGAIINSYFSSKSEDKKTDLEASDRLILQWEKLLDPLRARVTDLESKLEEARQRELHYKEEISTLKNQLMIFESSHVDIPLAMWMKDTQGKLVFINSIYEDEFLIPRGYTAADYLGKTDSAVWSEKVVKAFSKHDAKIIREKKFSRDIEPVDDGSGGFYYVDVLKYPRKLGAKVIGISGIIMGSALTREELIR